MAKTLTQTILFDVTPRRLFKLYMDEKMHTQLTGAKARVGTDVGSAFSALGGDIKGKLLYLKANQVIFQSWRYKNWAKNVPDSYLLLVFNSTTEGTELEVAHINIPESHFDAVRKGWNNFYWKRWRAYLLSGEKESRAAIAVAARKLGRKRKTVTGRKGVTETATNGQPVTENETDD